jgi:tRNA (cytidine56-2'-O)-methyltransferase
MTDHDVIILRLGYRLGRDPRITTHLALVARALGATKFLFSGDEDDRLPENIESVNQRFGGDMSCSTCEESNGLVEKIRSGWN